MIRWKVEKKQLSFRRQKNEYQFEPYFLPVPDSRIDYLVRKNMNVVEACYYTMKRKLGTRENCLLLFEFGHHGYSGMESI
jgi:hypothetical protein